MIIACLIFYNEEQFLDDWLERVLPCVDKVIAIDGQIEGFPGANMRSTDRSYKVLAANYASKVTLLASGELWPTEHDKRSSYLAGDPGDWYVVIDADEMLENGAHLKDAIDELSPAVDFARIKVVGYGPDRTAGRVIRHQAGLRYLKNHQWLGIGSEVLWQGKTGPVLETVYLRHRKDERTPERLKEKAKFHVTQSKTENGVLP